MSSLSYLLLGLSSYLFGILPLAATGIATGSSSTKPRLQYMFEPPAKTATQTAQSGEYRPCPTPIAPMIDMSRLFTFYKPHKTQSEIDRAAMSAYTKRVWPTQAVAKRLTRLIEQAIAIPGDRSAAHCIDSQLSVWAKAGALLGNLKDNDPKGHRQAILIGVWSGVGFANAYAIAAQPGSLPDPERQIIDAWLSRLSDEIVAEFTPPLHTRDPKDRWLDGNSNHLYWAGAAVGLMAVHLQDRGKFEWSMTVLRSALGAALPDGSLPRELSRGRRSLHYQNFALVPLTILVALADRNGIALTAAQERKLVKIAGFTANAFTDPSGLEALTGHRQEWSANMAIWIDILLPHLRQRAPDLSVDLDKVAATHRPFISEFIALPATQLFIGPN